MCRFHRDPDARTRLFLECPKPSLLSDNPQIIQGQGTGRLRTYLRVRSISALARLAWRHSPSISGTGTEAGRYINSMKVVGMFGIVIFIILSVMKQETDEFRQVRLFNSVRGARAYKPTLLTDLVGRLKKQDFAPSFVAAMQQDGRQQTRRLAEGMYGTSRQAGREMKLLCGLKRKG